MLEKERLFTGNEDRILIKYTLVQAQSPTRLRLHPFLAFRNTHHLSRKNDFVNTGHAKVSNGMAFRMYDNFSTLFIQFSQQPDFMDENSWFENIEYHRERERGYDFKEDLFVPGYFELPLKKGESIYVSAGLQEVKPAELKRKFAAEVKNRIPRDGFKNCLINAAQQLTVKRDDNVWIKSGFPWHGRKGRDTFIALPGFSEISSEPGLAKGIIDTMIREMKGPFFPESGEGENTSFRSADASLWFIYALQHYTGKLGSENQIWDDYGRIVKEILNAYRNGTDYNIRMQDNGLIYAGSPDSALTWMNVHVNGKPVNSRHGLAVEINALWYNAVRFALTVAEKAGDSGFVENWKQLPERIKESFNLTFRQDDKSYLADVVNENGQDWSVRPNQIIAASLPYSPLEEEHMAGVVDIVEKELLTPRGLRTLSPKNPDYKGTYYGDAEKRDMAAFQGSVYPWLFGHFAEAYLRLYGKGGISLLKKVYKDFECEMNVHGIGTISEVYDGDPPHEGRGCISQAVNIAELLRVGELIEKFETKTD